MARIGLFGEKINLEKVALLALLAACLAAPQLAKPFVDTFAFGTSYAKVYAFAAYAALLVFAKDAAAGAFGKRNPGAISIALISLLFAFGLAGHLLFLSDIEGETGVKYFAFDSHGYTAEHTLHIHALKVVFCPLGLPSDEYDCARPILAFLPQGYGQLGALLLLGAAASCAALYAKLEGKAEKIAFLILSFAALKTAVDGGIFNYENLAFLMLVPFALSEKNRLQSTLPGVAAWFPLAYLVYDFYDPLRLALPFLLFFYPVSVSLLDFRRLFPLLALSLFAPGLLITSSDAVADRWEPEPCANSGADSDFQQVVIARMHTPCETGARLLCGAVGAGNGTAIYSGFSSPKPELILSRALSKECSPGVFSIAEVQGSLRVVNNKA